MSSSRSVNDAKYFITRQIVWEYHVAPVKRKKTNALWLNIWFSQFAAISNLSLFTRFFLQMCIPKILEFTKNWLFPSLYIHCINLYLCLVASQQTKVCIFTQENLDLFYKVKAIYLIQIYPFQNTVCWFGMQRHRHQFKINF